MREREIERGRERERGMEEERERKRNTTERHTVQGTDRILLITRR